MCQYVPHVCVMLHTATLYATMSGTVLQTDREGEGERGEERGDKKEREGLPHRQIRDLEAPLVPQSQLPGSDGCLRSDV